jgi:hypothetical protein
MKIVAEYDPISGNITDASGTQWYAGINLNFEQYAETLATIPAYETEAIKLAQMGYTAEQLIALRKAGIL